jgi:aerobic C4-dicarboxylate transport protein
MPSGNRWYQHLYVQVLAAIALGAALGALAPEWGAAMKPLGDGFIKLIKMLIAPIVFCTVVTGIAGMGDLKGVGRVGVRALIYFELVSTLALGIGYVVVKTLQPGAGMNVDPQTLDMSGIAAYASPTAHLGVVDFLLNIIPGSVGEAFAKGEILQVLLLAVLAGVALAGIRDRGQRLLTLVDDAAHLLFFVVGLIMKLASVGAFGAMAFTVGKFGLGSLVSLGKLIAGVYLTCFTFVFVVLGAIAWANRFSLWKLLRYIREELLIVLGTSSSEPALPRLMVKLEALGCAKPVVGLVLPTGYSFNLDGTSIYLTMAALFIAQATNVDLTLTQEFTLIAVLMLTSKGAATVTGGGFVTLAATLAAVPSVPVAGLALLLGVDRFMSEARALTNLVGNAVATIVVARWEGAFDEDQARAVLDQA